MMNTSVMEDILTKLAAGRADDAELLDYARRALANKTHLRELRANWPVETLPVLGDYYCVTCLGRGASGVVYKALSLRGEPCFVAVKLLQVSSEREQQRFREREIEILKALSCPNVTRYLDSGHSGGRMYLVTELVEGEPLDEYLAAHTSSLEEKLQIFRHVCEVVSGLHEQGIIHRDLKPKHVLIDRQGSPWIVDFGLCAARTEDWPTRVRHARTELGQILGTVKYMAPEQSWGGLLPIDHRADIWALGIMLYELATDGDFPYDLGPLDALTGYDALLQRIQTDMPKKPRMASSSYSAALTTLISRCLAHEPRHRISSAALLARDLGRCLTRQSIQTKGLSLRYRLQRIAVGLAVHSRHSLWAATLCAVLLWLFAVSLVLGVRWRVVGRDFGHDTRQRLLADGGLTGGDEIVIAGISDDSMNIVPTLAADRGISGVTGDIRSWRAVHSRLMERLAGAHPRAVVWDCYFRTSQSGDAEFVQGVEALREVGVPLILGVSRYKDNGEPDLSPQLFNPISGYARHGLILAQDMVLREGEFVMALRRGDRVAVSLILSAFAAVAYPDCRLAVDWLHFDKTLRLIHYPRGGGKDFPAVDHVGLTTVYVASASRLGTRQGDVLGLKAFPLQPPQHWADRTIPYEKLFTAGRERLAQWVKGKVVVFGDLRTAQPFLPRDRHRVRYGTDIVDGVPGCYLICDALHGLLTNRYYRSETPLSPAAFVGIAMVAFLACLLAPKLACDKRFNDHLMQRGAVALLLFGALACTLVLAIVRSRLGVYAAMHGDALCLALTASLVVEFVRNRYRVRSLADPRADSRSQRSFSL